MTPYAQMLLSYVRPESQGVYAYEYQRYAKDPIVALMLAVFLGIFGGDGYYFGDWKRGVWMTLALFSGVGLFASIPIWIVRCFTIQNDCETYNDYLAWSLAHRYLPGNAPQPPEPMSTGKRPTISGLPVTVRG
ncbi:MAG TPA: TM2 domain-containing protein [Candidatus Aquilonibacter sp.]